jgi:mono/diheme cytochrome c family protein
MNTLAKTLALLAAGVAGAALAQNAPDPGLLSQGKKVYAKTCARCHGPGGDGQGFESVAQGLKARDFTQGIIKYQSTPAGTPPAAGDLERTVLRGISRTAMPHHLKLKEEERQAVVQYVRTFLPSWEAQTAPVAIPPPPRNVGSPTSLERGRAVYEALQCGSCHGSEGKGYGPQAAALPPDTLGNDQQPANFFQGRFKSGPGAEDLYRTLMVGVGGTSMGAYSEILERNEQGQFRQGDTWHLVYYLLSLQRQAALTK